MHASSSQHRARVNASVQSAWVLSELAVIASSEAQFLMVFMPSKTTACWIESTLVLTPLAEELMNLRILWLSETSVPVAGVSDQPQSLLA